jgi:polar amino acid transport system substrate-binding protein
MVVAFPENFFTTDEQLFFIEDLREAFSRIGYDLILDFYPAKRCLLMADSGAVDGLPRHPENLDNFYKNLIRVDIPVSDVTFAAYSVTKDLPGEGWEILRGSTGNILYIDGVRSVIFNLSSLISPDYIKAVKSRESALKMLLIERGDLLIDIEEDLDSVISQNQVAYEKIRKVGIMGHEERYIFLHKKHIALISELEKIIEEMKHENRFLYRIEQ